MEADVENKKRGRRHGLKNYDTEFKLKAVKLAKEIGFTKAARQLGISIPSLYSWKPADDIPLSKPQTPLSKDLKFGDTYIGDTQQMAMLLAKYPDRKNIFEAISRVKQLGYLRPVERDLLIRNAISVVHDSMGIDGEQSALPSLHKTLVESRAAAKTWINNGKQSKQVPVENEIPDGWKLGRIVTKALEEHQKRITAAAAIANRNCSGNARGSHWYTNGELNLQIRPGLTPPTGFVLGRHFTTEEKKHLSKNFKGSKTK